MPLGEHCQLKVCKILVENGININAADATGKTPLHEAVESNSMKIVEYLLQHGSQINLADDSGSTPLLMSMGHKTSTIATYLLLEGADPSIQDVKNRSPLHLAVERECIDLVRLLIEKGVEIDIEDEWMNTPLHAATRRGSLEMVNYLVSKGSGVNRRNANGVAPLHMAACGHRPLRLSGMEVDIIRALLEAGGDVTAEDTHGYTPLGYACSSGIYENVELLLQSGADPLRGKTTALHVAAGFHLQDVLKLLLQNVGNLKTLSTFGNTLLHVAMRLDLQKVVCRQSLSDHIRSEISLSDWTLVMDYLASDSSYNKPELLDTELAVDSMSRQNRCSNTEEENLLDMLFNNGCCLNATNNAGETALDVCVRFGQLGNENELLNRGADKCFRV